MRRIVWIWLTWALGGCAAGGVVPGPTSTAPKPPATATTQQSPSASAVTQQPPASAQSADSEISTSITIDELVGNEFLLVSATGYAPATQAPTRLGFREKAVMFTAGCNACMGSYDLSEGKLLVKNQQCTQRGCEPELEAKDEWLAAFLASSPKLAQRGGKLLIEGAEAKLEFLNRDVADPDRELTGSTWTMRTFLDSLGQWGFSLEVDPTVEFRVDGSFRVSTGCGTGGGRYRVNGQTLMLSGVTYRNQKCPTDNDERARQFVQGVLNDGEVQFAIDAARLRLARGELELVSSTD